MPRLRSGTALGEMPPSGGKFGLFCRLASSRGRFCRNAISVGHFCRFRWRWRPFRRGPSYNSPETGAADGWSGHPCLAGRSLVLRSAAWIGAPDLGPPMPAKPPMTPMRSCDANQSSRMPTLRHPCVRLRCTGEGGMTRNRARVGRASLIIHRSIDRPTHRELVDLA